MVAAPREIDRNARPLAHLLVRAWYRKGYTQPLMATHSGWVEGAGRAGNMPGPGYSNGWFASYLRYPKLTGQNPIEPPRRKIAGLTRVANEALRRLGEAPVTEEIVAEWVKLEWRGAPPVSQRLHLIEDQVNALSDLEFIILQYKLKELKAIPMQDERTLKALE